MADKKPAQRIAAENRRARYNYAIEDSFEAGIVLQGSEVKALREGRGNIAESYANVEGGELWLINSYIPPFSQAKDRTFGHEERRPRKLLAKAIEIGRLHQNIGRQGMTLVPLKLYFNDRGIAKLEIGLARGKKTADKRETERQRDWQREKARLLKQG
ncbi:MAG: SsrA-binding protein SmpB [Pseudomonadota bacterium]